MKVGEEDVEMQIVGAENQGHRRQADRANDALLPEGVWALGELHESFKDFWIGLGEGRRTPFAADPKASFEKVHASIAARIKGGRLSRC